MNAMKHGFRASKDLAVPEDEREEFEKFLDGVREDLNPVGQIQCALVDRIATCAWRLRRVVSMESVMLMENTQEGEGFHRAFTYRGNEQRFITLTRYESMIERGMYQALSTLTQIKRLSPVPNPDRTSF